MEVTTWNIALLLLRLLVPVGILLASFGPAFPWFRWNQHSREKLLQLRFASPTPNELRNLKTVDEATAPELFQDHEKLKQERAEERERARAKAVPKAASRKPPADGQLRSEDLQNVANQAEAERKMQMESLVNFVAFQRREPQRVFLPQVAPPSPPRVLVNADAKASATVVRANLEAQVVLKGAMRLVSCGASVARGLHAQFTAQNIDITQRTFGLMVEAGVHAHDLPAASDFLMKMETAGHTPGDELLDKVMELFLFNKSNSKTVQAKKAEEPATSDTAQHPSAGVPSVQVDGGQEAREHVHAPELGPSRDCGEVADSQRRALTPRLPAFSIPDEFATGRHQDVVGEVPALPAGAVSRGTTLSADAPEFVPGSLTGASWSCAHANEWHLEVPVSASSAWSESASQDLLCATALEFTPGATPGSTVGWA
eukprot:CAMPEP_0194480360 /NCGR_PEP_ID=MMETSP0253-20130528/3182_1 /TAXON_ID=2966 /ORGANISM="Noctiluca scintillans" /LENGTH=428 /DNA_ID=CAMNT_0039319729 /DNA_START=35 /DNA_END=1321 /DNA_ORIENTATION=+